MDLEELKLACKIDADTEDVLVQGWLAAAKEIVERSGRRLLTQTWKVTLDRFPCSRTIVLPLFPVQSVSSITYYDASNTSQTLSSSNYLVDITGSKARIELLSTSTWPATYDRMAAVTITFVVGATKAPDVPAVIRAALMLLVGHFYANRETVRVGNIASEIPLGGYGDAIRACLHSDTMLGMTEDVMKVA